MSIGMFFGFKLLIQCLSQHIWITNLIIWRKKVFKLQIQIQIIRFKFKFSRTWPLPVLTGIGPSIIMDEELSIWKILLHFWLLVVNSLWSTPQLIFLILYNRVILSRQKSKVLILFTFKKPTLIKFQNNKIWTWINSSTKILVPKPTRGLIIPQVGCLLPSYMKKKLFIIIQKWSRCNKECTTSFKL